MKDLQVAKKFILEYLPQVPASQLAVTEIFDALEKDPTQILFNALVYTRLAHFKDPNESLAVNAINSFVAGFALAYGMQFPETMKMVEGYIEHQSKGRGENVTSLLTRKRK